MGKSHYLTSYIIKSASHPTKISTIISYINLNFKFCGVIRSNWIASCQDSTASVAQNVSWRWCQNEIKLQPNYQQLPLPTKCHYTLILIFSALFMPGGRCHCALWCAPFHSLPFLIPFIKYIRFHVHMELSPKEPTISSSIHFVIILCLYLLTYSLSYCNGALKFELYTAERWSIFSRLGTKIGPLNK